jgi:hypothetical protein
MKTIPEYIQTLTTAHKAVQNRVFQQMFGQLHWNRNSHLALNIMQAATLYTDYTDSTSDATLSVWRGVPWYIWCALAGITSVMIGVHWDISWHTSIGRDTFWTPAHVAIYMCGVLSGAAFGYLIFKTTFDSGAVELRAASVKIFGLRGPLGAFIAGWGGITMLTSAPFDNWWHNAYGLDVKIVSPPHMVLFTGIFAVIVGTLVLIASFQNRTVEAELRNLYRVMFLYTCSVLLVMSQGMLMEFTERQFLHMHQPYILTALVTLAIVGVARRGTQLAWAATWVCGFYTAYRIGLILVLPLFPAEPGIGPVFHQVTQFIPPEFPLLILLPAILLDLFWARTKNWPWLLSALAASAVFVLAFSVIEWPFSDFLQSPLSRNWFFGTDYMGFGTRPTSLKALHQFFATDSPADFAGGLFMAWAVGAFALWFGGRRGEWLSRLER